MKKAKIKSFYIFNILAVLIVVIFFILYFLFQDMKKFIIETNYNENINYVKNLSDNIVRNMKTDDGDNFILKLKNDKLLRKKLENELSLFVTDRYKYVYIVDRKNGKFRFLLDGSKEDKGIFLESYEPIELKKWNQIYSYKKDIYFTHKNIESLWVTYLKPIIFNNKVVAILVIDFSMKEHLKIKKALNKLNRLFEFLIYFFIFIFLIIIWFSVIDLKRKQELFELNRSLKVKVKEEIEKNRKKDEQLLYQSKLAQMGEMISMIAHQWRQPLSAISATAISLKLKTEMGKLSNNLILEKMDILINYTTHLSNTIEDFRNFFKPTKQKELVSYDEIIKSVKEIIGISLTNRNIELELDIKYKKKLLIFSNELKQVILNFVKNSEDVLVENKIENRKIKIEVYKKNEFIIFEIKDNGGGIDDKIKNKIFEPYFSTKDKKNGTGLGLYMSKIIVEKHLDGKLNFFNNDEGVVFQIILKENTEDEIS